MSGPERFPLSGHPPVDEEYERLAASDFADYRVAFGGLVDNPVTLSLADLHELGHEHHISNHNCIQGWSSVAEWGGTPLSKVVDRVQPHDVTTIGMGQGGYREDQLYYANAAGI